MKSRKGFEICLPILLFGAACMLSAPTFILVVLWMLIGTICLGYREFKTFPANGIDPKWRSGARGAILWFYHIAWWPWYMREDIARIAAIARQKLQRHRQERESKAGDHRSQKQRDDHPQ